MNILAMDDERLALERIVRLLKELGYTCQTAQTREAFETLCDKEHFNLFILDISMPEISGIELAQKILHQNPKAFIIFQTAHQEFTLKAFELGAIDYLLKPYGKEELQRSLHRALSYQKNEEISFMTRNKKETYLIKAHDIFYIQADLNEVIIRTKEHFSYLEQKISTMESLLDNELFFKIHRSYLINTSKIKSMQTLEQSKIEFSFEGIEESIVSSKDGAKKFRERYKEIKC